MNKGTEYFYYSILSFFKGPLAATPHNKYLFIAIDEYSRFPFGIPCPNMSSETVIKCLDQIFTLCGTAGYIHSDRGAALLSKEVKDHLNNRGIVTCKTTPYNPRGNGQVEVYNRSIWKAVRLALKVFSYFRMTSLQSILEHYNSQIHHQRF